MSTADRSLELTFIGGAGAVTGSCHLLEAGSARVLVDCGLHQERDLLSRNWDPLPVPADRIDAVLLTHAHLDHCGLLPRLLQQGFSGTVWCTPATAEVARIVMADSARIQVEDAEHKRWRHEREGRTGPRPVVPLYTEEDAERAGRRMATIACGQRLQVADGIEAEFIEAGHIIGSSCIKVHARGRTVLFSGDIGRWNKPLLNDPQPCGVADYVLTESTYGDRRHDPDAEIPELLREVIRSTVAAGGHIVIPSFAIERAQELLYWLGRLEQAKAIPRLTVFLDSPMATQVTEVFAHHPECFDEEMRGLIARHQSPFDLPGLAITRSAEQSKAINSVREPSVIIAGSGMCTGGRIKHHLTRNLPRRESTILFVGYQANGTLGRQILDGAKQVRLFGQTVPVRARVARIGGFSAHADRDELVRWSQGVSPTPRRVFVVHGEPEVAARFRDTLARERRWPAEVAAADATVSLD